MRGECDQFYESERRGEPLENGETDTWRFEGLNSFTCPTFFCQC